MTKLETPAPQTAWKECPHCWASNCVENRICGACRRPFAVPALELARHVERLAEVCWEATRAFIRSECDTSTATDPRVPVKWCSASAMERATARAQVLQWWHGDTVEPTDAAGCMCHALVQAYRDRSALI